MFLLYVPLSFFINWALDTTFILTPESGFLIGEIYRIVILGVKGRFTESFYLLSTLLPMFNFFKNSGFV